LTFNTLHNPYEQHKVVVIGEGYSESITFEGLPQDMEDELIIGDAVVNKNKTSSFTLMNSSDHVMKFNWNQGDKDEFRFYPQVGHIQGHTTK